MLLEWYWNFIGMKLEYSCSGTGMVLECHWNAIEIVLGCTGMVLESYWNDT